MKQSLTLFTLFVSSWFFTGPIFAQCNFSLGGNGHSIALANGITIDGDMNDWIPILNDPDNNTFDATSGTDLDAPVSDVGRDLVQFAFTEDLNNLYIYLKRVGSTTNSVDIIFYADLNNNDMMEYGEPVIHLNWGGSNGNVTVSIYDYIPSLINPLYNKMSFNLDGSSLKGTLLYRTSVGNTGKGSSDGKSVEARIPFSKLITINPLGATVDNLFYGKDFKFHVSTINGNVSSVPGLNSINDNFGGCLSAPLVVLPVKLVSFGGNLNKNKINLQWTVDNETADKFEVERSIDGINFTTAALLFSSEKIGSENYKYNESLSTTGKVYYRLRMYDKSQKISYSKILAFDTKPNIAKEIRILNNPVTDKLTLSFQTTASQQIHIKVYDMTGRVQVNESAVASQGINLYSYQFSSSFKSGLYIVELNDGEQRYSTKFVKQ